MTAHAAPPALIRTRRIGEAIAYDPLARCQSRPDFALAVLASGREHQQQLGARRHAIAAAGQRQPALRVHVAACGVELNLQRAFQMQQSAVAVAHRQSGEGFRLVSGGTDNHLFLVDLRANLPELTAKKAQETLDLVEANLLRTALDQQPVHEILQLADVAGPRVVAQAILRSHRETPQRQLLGIGNHVIERREVQFSPLLNGLGIDRHGGTPSRKI
mgnify:CR=1 FL=1